VTPNCIYGHISGFTPIHTFNISGGMGQLRSIEPLGTHALDVTQQMAAYSSHIPRVRASNCNA